MGIKIKITVLLSLTTNFIVAQNTLKELKKYALHYCIAHNYHLIDEQANYICYLCTDFYESQELHHFIKRLIRKYRKKQPLSDE